MAEFTVGIQNESGVPDAIHLALLIEIQVGAVNREPDLGDFGIGFRGMKGVN